uniref:Mediator complex subunit Med12 domain-containing protein n=1 Tax=Kalanchoe fedtschenkoi TaxID=63787 RepID=A0A7N0UQH3_KALFE
MQRFHGPSVTSAVNNSTIGGTSIRDTVRADSSSVSANSALNSRKSSPITAYKLKCDKDPLNSRLGPPDYHPQTSNCPEETLNREYAQSGYRDMVEGLEEAREISLSQVQTFTKPVVLKCKEAIRKRLRAINESRAQKRKAGQVYGVPLGGSLLSKPGIFPDQKPCSEDYRKRWIEGLSQPHKRLRTLASQIPHGYRKKALFDVLIKNNVPILRATWFIKVNYLNQVRPGAFSSSGTPDKTQISRSELWTKDIIDYLQHILDELFCRVSSRTASHGRERSTLIYSASIHHKGDQVAVEGDGPSLHFKWSYVVRLLQWHHSEGLLQPSLIIDWVLSQLEGKEWVEILLLTLPIIYSLVEIIVLCQTYVRNLVGAAIRFMKEPLPAGSDLVDNSRRAYATSALTELLRYLIMAVPETFVAFDCFPLPQCVLSCAVSDAAFLPRLPEDARKNINMFPETAYFKDRRLDSHYWSSLNHIVASIQAQADSLAKTASPGYPGYGAAKAVQALDKALLQGDVREAYKFLFEDHYDGVADQTWMMEVSPRLQSALKWIGTTSLSVICSVFFLCEWATCDFRDFRNARLPNLKFSGRKDFCHVYIAVRLLKMKLKDLHDLARSKKDGATEFCCHARGFGRQFSASGKALSQVAVDMSKVVKNSERECVEILDMFESPGPLHDIIVCWIDQHETQGEGSKRVQFLLTELARSGIFYPPAYVRQLIVSGYTDADGPLLDKKKRHHRILKQLPASFMRDFLEEAQSSTEFLIQEVVHVYSNERRLVLRGLVTDLSQKSRDMSPEQKFQIGSINKFKSLQTGDISVRGKNFRSNSGIADLKAAISLLFQFPQSSSTSVDAVTDESQATLKKFVGLNGNNVYKLDQEEGTVGCEECRKVKRQKLSDERGSSIQVESPSLSDDEDCWWVRKGTKLMDMSKVEPPAKQMKQTLRGRQKGVRKMQSLAQLACTRIESSLGASTSHTCDNRVSCSHHKSGLEGETVKTAEVTKLIQGGDIVSLGIFLKKLSFIEKRTLTAWLINTVTQFVEEMEKKIKANQFNRPYPGDEKSYARWKLGEDELSCILYLLDVSNDLVSATHFLLWLLPKVPCSVNPAMHTGRNVLLMQRNMENHICEVGEACLLSSIRRYEHIFIATDRIPEILSACMHRTAAVMSSNERVASHSAMIYARYLLKKYGSLPSVIEWEKNFRTSCDKRLLSELESGRALDGDHGFPLGVPNGVKDIDDYLRQKISGGRLSRVGISMRDLVQKYLDEATHYFLGKERKLLASGASKTPLEKWDVGYQVSQQIIVGLMECIRQTGGAAQEGDPSLASSAVSAIVSNVGPAVTKLSDFTGSFNTVRRIIRVLVTCLSSLKDALGERQSRVFEIALATEASSALAAVLTPGKTAACDASSNLSSDTLNSSAKTGPGKSTKIAAAVSTLVVKATIQGVISLERMVSVLRIKEGLDVIHFIRSAKSSANGNSRTAGVVKMENSVETYVHWFRLLIGNCRSLLDGLISELLGEPSVVALCRMQRTLPISLIFPPAYSMFAFMTWKSFILNNLGSREDIHQLYVSLTSAVIDAVHHLPFRDACFRDTHGLYDLVAADGNDAELAAIMELNDPDSRLKSMGVIPLRARLFLNALIECEMPSQDDAVRGSSGHADLKDRYSEINAKLLDKLVHVLDTLQPAKFHWQWVELRLLLNEQALIEKYIAHDISFADALRSLSSNTEKATASENENNFIELILTRLLVRPDAAPLFSEVVHLFGRSLDDSMLLQAKWFLGGQDVLFGRKSIRQRLINIAEGKGLSTKPQFHKPWGWARCSADYALNKGNERKHEASSLEEGEVAEEAADLKRSARGSQMVNFDVLNSSQRLLTEKALTGIVLPCIDQSSDDSRNTFATDLIKQLNNIEQQVAAVTRGTNKQSGLVSSGHEGAPNKGNSRKGVRGGSPGLARRTTAQPESIPTSPSALRASMSLRLQFILRLLPVIWSEGDRDSRNMRHMLASVVLRLLGSPIVYEDADLLYLPMQIHAGKREKESRMDCSSTTAASVNLVPENVFDRLLLVLHGLLSSYKPSWLKSKTTLKSSNDHLKDVSIFDREMVESLQNDLERMHLPDSIKRCIKSAMPVLMSTARCSISCQPPTVPAAAIVPLQMSMSISQGNSSQSLKNATSKASASPSWKAKALLLQPEPHDIEIDPWQLLEDGAGSGSSSSSEAAVGAGDTCTAKASSWLKGAVRVRRADLTYIGAVDDDS